MSCIRASLDVPLLSLDHAWYNWGPGRVIFNSMQCQCQYKTDPQARILYRMEYRHYSYQSASLCYNTQGAVSDANKVSMWTMSYRRHCDDGTGYNLNLLQGELMTLGPGKLCHCCVHADCRVLAHKLISFPHFPYFI